MSDALTIKDEDIVLLQRTHFNMTNQSPDLDQIERIERLREAAKIFVSMIYVNCPRTRERSLAITGLEDTLMWAVASIAREKFGEES